MRPATSPQWGGYKITKLYNAGDSASAHRAEPHHDERCQEAMRNTGMDAHTLELLEFNKIRELLAGYAVSSLGKDLARQLEPSTDREQIAANLALVTEMVEAVGLD